MKTFALALLLAGACALPARAEVEPVSLSWQLIKKRAAPAKPAEVAEIELKPGADLNGRLQARLRLRNRGPAVEGVLLRYVVTAQIDRLEDDGQEPAWSLPFMLEEKRIPKIGSNQFFETTLDPSAMVSLYLKKVNREGFWPREFKLQVLVAPRRENKAPLQILESLLPVKF